MNKDLKARIEAASEEIVVQVTQRHIDLFRGQRFDFEDNPIGQALKEKGWVVISIGTYDCFIGGRDGGVPYTPDSETSARIARWIEDNDMEPFIAQFDKQPPEVSQPAERRPYEDAEISRAFY
jgi:hypothetical protein